MNFVHELLNFVHDFVKIPNTSQPNRKTASPKQQQTLKQGQSELSLHAFQRHFIIFV